MFSIVIEFSKESQEKIEEVYWLALHSYFQFSFPDSFICILKPYKGDESQAKVFFKNKDAYLESVLSSSSQIEVNGHLCMVLDCNEKPDSCASRARVMQLPSHLAAFDAVTEELRVWFGASVRCLNPGLPGSNEPLYVSVAACTEEVLESALSWLARLQLAPVTAEAPATAAAPAAQAASTPTAGTSYAAATVSSRTEASTPSGAAVAPVPAPASASRRPRRPLFPEALLAEAAAASASSSPPVVTQQQQQQQQQPPPAQSNSSSQDSDSRIFHFGPLCQLRVDLSDLTALPGGGVDLLIVPTNLTLSLQYGLAKAVASRCRDVDTDSRRHLSSLPGGAMAFGDTYLCHRGGGGFRKILFIALPNDRRLERQLGSGDSFRRAMDDCLDRLLIRLARMASSEGLQSVAMPTLGSSLPLWGGGSHEWAEALAGAIVRLVESGALAGSGSSKASTLELRVCCVARDAVLALAGAVARRLPGEVATSQSTASAALASINNQPPESIASAPPDESVPEAMDTVPDNDPDNPASGSCLICSNEFSANCTGAPFHCDPDGRQLCRGCVDRMSDPLQPNDGKCVLCFQRYRPAVGNQPPNGSMIERIDQRPLLGFNQFGTIVIKYNFPPGTHEGVKYKGIARDAYFPNNEDGRSIVTRLRAAFNGRVVFQLGQSATTGQQTAITWNTIHHKTRPDGGPANHGYPDPGYLKRVSDELSALGY